MVLKTYIAALCAAGVVGGVVYFGTNPANTSGSVAINQSVNATEAELLPQEGLAGEQAEETNILRRYIGKGDKEVDDAPKPENPYRAVNSDDLENGVSELNTEVDLADEDVAIVTELEIADQDGAHNGKHRQAIKREPGKQVTVTETVIETETPTSQKTQQTKKQTVKPERPLVSSDDPAKIRIDTVFEQAKAIEQSDLRDRAYLDLTDYATNKGMFDDAQRAAVLIEQPELRDTARSRIAMGMARYGMSDEAFALIEDVEINELKDVMRLQVIEALLGTDIRR